jgi:hypothetical protein
MKRIYIMNIELNKYLSLYKKILLTSHVALVENIRDECKIKFYTVIIL